MTCDPGTGYETRGRENINDDRGESSAEKLDPEQTLRLVEKAPLLRMVTPVGRRTPEYPSR